MNREKEFEKIEIKKECSICGNTFCFCKHKKFTATITHIFEGSNEKEVNNVLRKANRLLLNLDLKASRGVYPNSVHKNTYDKALIQKAVDSLSELITSYNYTEEEVEKVIEGLMDSVRSEVEQHYQEVAYDRAYDQMKDDLAMEQYEQEIKNEK